MDLTTNSPLKLVPGIAVFQLTVKKPLPTNAKIQWNFGDHTPLVIEYLQVDSSSMFTKRYGYQQKGEYKTIITIFNNVSKISFNRLIDVQEIVQPEIGFFIKSNNKHLDVGRGVRNNVFAYRETIYINVTKQQKDLSYEFNFGDNEPTKTKTLNYITYTYSIPGHYNVSIKVNNQIELMNTERTIIIQQPLQDIAINLNETSNLNKPVTFNINTTIFGTDVCGYVDFGDNTTYVFNKNNCNASKIQYLDMIRKLRYVSFDYSNLILDHAYTIKGYFNVTVHLENTLSQYHDSKEVFVVFKPCPNPSIVILESGVDNKSPRIVKRSNAVQLKSEVECVCPYAINVTFNWEIFQEKNGLRVFHQIQQSPFPLARRLVEMPDPRLLTIPQNLLEFGQHRVDLTVSFVSLDTDLSEVVAKNSTWLLVKPSNLKAVIQGKEIIY